MQALVLVELSQVRKRKFDAATFHLDCNGLLFFEASIREIEPEKLHFFIKLQAEVPLSEGIADFFCAVILLLLLLLIKALDDVTQTDLLRHLKLALVQDEGSQRFIIYLKLFKFARLPLQYVILRLERKEHLSIHYIYSVKLWSMLYLF